MKGIFCQIVLEVLVREGLGIEPNCLAELNRLIDRVLDRRGRELLMRETFVRAVADFEQFLARMVEEARATGAGRLHEGTFARARQRCGLIFWCEA